MLAESDSTKTIQACSGEDRWWDKSAAIFMGCINTVALIRKVSFSHVLTEENRVLMS
jgi:hypothetical protein